jgi:hypothetical protein
MRADRKLIFYFTVRLATLCYMIKRPAVLIIGLMVLYIGLAVVFLLVMPEPRGPFEYLVAGAFATGICLVIVFALNAKSILGRTARRNERSS